ncbi:uncharacterized protein Bfra_004498 [Botrytis fragariae]|uniref:Uncharacterized protein n=1 Tax=Botrytis fragariae TaxID=1964551 RepID=A0A8H6EJF4_9HELO|nr:uncharacterized protein Bfra_004498 [Botrytis fragariae]KAF5874488.1 hypothetical protein Bfra_004498 [Botrytis fragariae]
MPNWKSYEATVRLLSAIVAAHPSLKLDYAAISKYYGDESNYQQIWRGMNGIKRNAESLRKAVDAGLNASTVNLENDFSVKKAISVRFGGDCTASALDNRFRRLKSDAKLINAAVARGEDPILMNVGDTNGEIACKGKGGNELMFFLVFQVPYHKSTDLSLFAYTNAVLAISVLMGSATPASHIQSQLRETIKPLGERLIAMRDAGEDCKDVDLTDLGTRRYKAEIAAKMGSDVTAISVKAQFRRSLRVLAAQVAKYMGSDVTSTAIKIQYNATIRALSRRQIAFFDAGKDPLDVSLNNPKGEIVAIMGSDVTVEAIKQQIGKRVKVLGSRQTKMRTAEMDKHMGDCTISGLRFQFDTRYKVIAKRQKAMLAAGKNPLTVDIVTGGKTEVQKCFGSDATPGGIKFQFATTIKKNVDQIRNARAAGKDCKDITFNSNEMAKHFGSDTDVTSIKWQFRGIRAGAKIQKDAVLNGKDPKEFDVALNPDPRKRSTMAKWLDDGTTTSALEHRFRPIKAAAKNATAEKFGDGVTGKAVSMRMERMRKEPPWDLNSPPGTNDSLGATPKKARAQRTPKKSVKKAAASSNEEGDDDSDMEMATPSKKGSPVKKENLNKVKVGRVEKKPATPSRAAKTNIKSYVDSDDEGDDDLIIKDEDISAYDFGRAADGDEDMLGGGGFGGGNGHGLVHGNRGDDVEEEDVFYDDES